MLRARREAVRRVKSFSPDTSKQMREIFLSPAIPHDDLKFVKGLAGAR